MTLSGEGSVQRLSVQYPGGLAARYRWGGSGTAEAVFGISEAEGTLNDFGELAAPSPDSACRAELRVEGPVARWTARFASPIFDDPEAVLLDTAGLLVVRYGFIAYALEARTGALAWQHVSGTPTVAILASSRLDHVVLQTELETIALRADGSVAWRAAHSDVVVDARLIAGRLDLTTYSGQHLYLDAQTGQASWARLRFSADCGETVDRSTADPAIRGQLTLTGRAAHRYLGTSPEGPEAKLATAITSRSTPREGFSGFSLVRPVLCP